MAWRQKVCLTALVLFSVYLSAMYLRPISTTDQLRWIRLTVLPVNGANKSTSLSSHSKKFIFAFQYYEQLGHGTRNLLDLCSLAKSGERYVVAPYVRNSKMKGIPFRFPVGYLNPLQSYFDLRQVNNKLKSNGYSTLTSFEDMAHSCNRRFDVIVLFLFRDERKSAQAAALSYQITVGELEDINLRTSQNHGWTNCMFIKNSDVVKQLIAFNASRYVCVDPEVIRTWEKFEEKVLRGANCVGIVKWTGVGYARSQFVLSNSSVLRPSDLQHNAHLINLAKTFVRTSGLGKSFISVHVRTERHLRFFGGINVTRECFHRLAATVQMLKGESNWNVYLSSDLQNDGSGSLKRNMSYAKRQGLYRELKRVLGYPVTLSHMPAVTDNGAKAIIEMHVLAAGKKLVTLGRGSFQQWIIELFSRNTRNLTASLYRICP